MNVSLCIYNPMIFLTWKVHSKIHVSEIMWVLEVKLIHVTEIIPRDTLVPRDNVVFINMLTINSDLDLRLLCMKHLTILISYYDTTLFQTKIWDWERTSDFTINQYHEYLVESLRKHENEVDRINL